MSKKLLLADDSITIQKVIGITFANEDYELVTVDNGAAALEKARSERPDLILADVFMPGKNGYELCAAVRQDPSLRGVPVLLLTGTFEPFDENKARAAGADSWIAKPFESQALIDRVEELLARAPQPAAEEAVRTAAPAAAPAGDFSQDEPTEAAAEEVSPFGAPARAETAEEAFPGAEGEEVAPEEDIWGAISFDEEDLLVEEPPGEAAVDIWSALEEEEPASAALSEEAFVFGEEPAKEAVPAFETPEAEEEFIFDEEEEPLETASPAAGWDELEEEILPLDEMDIIEEEDIEAVTEASAEEEFVFAGEEEAFPPGEPAVPAVFGEIGGMPEAAEEPIAFEEEPISFGEEPISFGEESAAEEEFALTEEGPEWGVAEETAAAIEPSAPASEEVFLGPAEAAVEPEPAAAAAIPVVEERVRALSEEELARIVERVAGSVIERLAGSVLERIVWEVVPDLAESLVREEIRKIREEAQ